MQLVPTASPRHDEGAEDRPRGVRCVRRRPRAGHRHPRPAGDSSDNIPGVRGVGEKTATDLVTRHSSSSRSTRTSIVGSEARASSASATPSCQEARHHRDRRAAWDRRRAITIRPADRAKLDEISRAGRSRVSLPAPRRETPAPAAPPPAAGRTTGEKIAASAAQLRHRARWTGLAARGGGRAAGRCVTETTSVQPMARRRRPIGVGDGRAFYVPLGHRTLDAPRQLPWRRSAPRSPAPSKEGSRAGQEVRPSCLLTALM